MGSNPFYHHSLLNGPLERDICQHIHYTALTAVVHGHDDHHSSECPETVPLPLLRQKARKFGREVYLSHPATLDDIFAGMTLAVYQTVDDLYCSRLERRITVVWAILNAMAREAGVPRVTYEAVWATCLYLSERRARSVEVAVQHLSTEWGIALLSYLESSDQAPPHRVPHDMIACIVDLSCCRILSFRMTNERSSAADCALAFYDALVLSRHPHQHSLTGLTWQVPQRLVAEGTLPAECRACCERLGILIEDQRGPSPFVQQVHQRWRQEYTHRNIRADRWAASFDSFLHKAYGQSPLRTHEYLERDYAHLKGYGRDPAWQCPPLCTLLPKHSAAISDDGEIVLDGLHYEDDLLSYWPSTPVVVQRSEQTEARLWVYLEGEILCQAMARELRRQDGSYQAFRRER